LNVIDSEIRYDPLTGDSGRICHFILNPVPPAGLEELVRLSAVKCPFCPQAVTQLTPRFPEDLVPAGRLKHRAATLFPNLFPYDDISAVTVIAENHFLPLSDMPITVIEDGLRVTRDFFHILEERLNPTAPSYGILVWNYMPPAGASQIHPHMQVIYTSNPGSRLRRELAAEKIYRERYGRIYREDLLRAEQSDGARWLGETGSVAWFLPFVPTGLLGDCVAVFPGKSTVAALSDDEIGDFAKGLRKLLRLYADLGVWSFNLMFFPDSNGSGADTHWLTAQLVPRLYLNSVAYVTDVSYPQLLMGERLSMVYPEETAAKLALGR
jgi:galactose-1-phosphate uridylyltransferase